MIEVQQRGVVGEPLRVTPIWATWIVLSSAALLLAVVLGAFWVSVDVTSMGRGILQAKGAPQVLSTQVAGTVVEVRVRSGDKVTAREPIAELQSAATAAALLEADNDLTLASRSLAQFRAVTKPLWEARRARQLEQIGALEGQTASGRASVRRMRVKSKSTQAMTAQGLASNFEAVAADEQADEALRQLLVAQQAKASAREQLLVTSADIVREEWQLERDEQEARAHRDGLKYALEASVVRSPSDGVIGSLVVRPGDTLQAGAFVGRVVTADTPRVVVAYLPERDRAFVEEGTRQRVEIDQLPFWEFGALNARVARVSSEMASEHELRETLGDHVRVSEPLYRIDLDLEDDAAFRKLQRRLRPESLVNVRFTLRRRQVITLLFEPLRRWLD